MGAESKAVDRLPVGAWRAIPHPANPAELRAGPWLVVAGNEGGAGVWIDVVAEHPKDVAEFIVAAVRDYHARQARTYWRPPMTKPEIWRKGTRSGGGGCVAVAVIEEEDRRG